MSPSTNSTARSMAKTILLVGAGQMGGAMLESWLRQGMDPSTILVQDPGASSQRLDGFRARGVTINPTASAHRPLDWLVLAIKPQMFAAAASSLSPFFGPNSAVLSIMAGKRLNDLAHLLPQGTALVRAMPNTPASVGRGITVATTNAAVTAEQKLFAHHLLQAMGAVEWIEDEGLMDAVTAVSGSGPAYVFHFVEALAQAGAKAGLPADLAMRLARATVAGAGELLVRSDQSAEALRQAVTSPGGTTQAALAVLMDTRRLTDLMIEAVDAAKRRAEELAG